jgi:DNA repair protein RecO (recombination protein O)
MGKLRLVAKGARRSASRMAGHLEPFCHSQLMVARGRDLDLATQASTVEAFRRVREDLVRSSLAFHLTELVDSFFLEGDSHPGAFVLLHGALSALDDEPDPPNLIVVHFELHLLDEAGFRPELTTCLACGGSIEPGRNGYSVPLGGVVCPACLQGQASAQVVPVAALKLLRVMQREPEVKRLRFAVPRGVLNDVEGLLQRTLEFVLERRLRSTSFLRQLAEAGVGYAT